jgi:hypothetical protein
MLYHFKITDWGYYSYVFFNKKWFIDKIYTDFLILPFLKWSNIIFYEIFDKGLLEHVGAYQISQVFETQNKKILFLQIGFLYKYMYIFFIGTLFFVISTLVFFSIGVPLVIMKLIIFFSGILLFVF